MAVILKDFMMSLFGLFKAPTVADLKQKRDIPKLIDIACKRKQYKALTHQLQFFTARLNHATSLQLAESHQKQLVKNERKLEAERQHIQDAIVALGELGDPTGIEALVQEALQGEMDFVRKPSREALKLSPTVAVDAVCAYTKANSLEKARLLLELDATDKAFAALFRHVLYAVHEPAAEELLANLLRERASSAEERSLVEVLKMKPKEHVYEQVVDEDQWGRIHQVRRGAYYFENLKAPARVELLKRGWTQARIDEVEVKQ